MRRNYDELRVNHESGVPLSVQLAVNLGRAIRAGWWGVDEALPSERMLSGWLKLSRVTTRRAYDMLVQEGLVYRRRGAGSFVKQTYEQPLGRLLGFSEIFKSRGMHPQSYWLSKKIDKPTADEALALGIGLDEPVLRLKRQRVIKRMPISYEINVLPAWVVSDPDKITNSLYEYLDQTENGLFRARQHILAMNATEQVAKYCRIPVGQAILQVMRVGFNRKNQIIEYSITYCRSDYYDFTLELNRYLGQSDADAPAELYGQVLDVSKCPSGEE